MKKKKNQGEIQIPRIVRDVSSVYTLFVLFCVKWEILWSPKWDRKKICEEKKKKMFQVP